MLYIFLGGHHSKGITLRDERPWYHLTTFHPNHCIDQAAHCSTVFPAESIKAPDACQLGNDADVVLGVVLVGRSPTGYNIGDSPKTIPVDVSM